MSQLPSFFCKKKKKKLESHKKVCENKDFCNIIMPPENKKILEFNQYQKSAKAQFIIYADLECVIEKIKECKNNLENSSTAKIGKRIPSDFKISAISSFNRIENKHDVHRGKDYMKKLCESVREHAMKIIFFHKNMKLLTKE